MKKLLAAMFVALLMVGCGEPDLSDPEVLLDTTVDVVNIVDLEDRVGVMYLPNEETPFTGRTESFYENGQKGAEGNFKDGKQDGLWTGWYENGQKRQQINYKDGKSEGLYIEWDKNGQKKFEANYKDGKLNGTWTEWNKDGTEEYRITYKDGERVVD